MNKSGSRDELAEGVYRIARDRGLDVVENNLETVITGLIKQKEKYGKYYCPCQVIGEGRECPCETLDEQIKKKGTCHCNLFKRKA